MLWITPKQYDAIIIGIILASLYWLFIGLIWTKDLRGVGIPERTDNAPRATQNENLQGLMLVESNSLIGISPPVYLGKQLKVLATLTAYNPTYQQCDSTPCISASGMNICETKKKICACPREYPFGTKIEINGEIWECQDRLSLKYNHRIDLLMETKQEAMNWGKKTQEVVFYR